MSKISKKDLKKIILEQSDNIKVPNLKIKIHENIQKDYQLTHKKEPVVNKRNYFKFKIAPFALSFALIIIVVGLFIINYDKPSLARPLEKINKAKATYVMQATSLFNYADDSVFNSNSEVMSYTNISNNEKTNYNHIATQISENLEAVEEIFNKDNTKYELIKQENEQYEYKMQATINVGTEIKTYVMYYNEAVLYDKHQNKNVDEVSSKIEGYIESNNVKYYLQGIKEIEEDETEIEFKLYLNAQKTNYIVVSQEIEARENEYNYIFFENNKMIKEIEIEKQTRNKTEVIELSIENKEENTEEEYEFIKKDNYIYVSFEENEIELEAVIYIEQDVYKFDFGNNNIVIIDRKNSQKKQKFNVLKTNL